MIIKEVLEQRAIFDGEPDFIHGSLVINILNHNSYGGTMADLSEFKNTGELKNPKLYLVRVTVEYEEIQSL